MHITPQRRVADSPQEEYQQRWTARAQAAARHARRERAIRWFKRALLFSVIGYVVFDPTESFALFPLAVVIVPLTAVHEWVIRAWRRAAAAAQYYQRALARLAHRWIGVGPSGARYRDTAHLYADDLDLFGRGSLFQLLCTACTRVGQDALAAWLAAPAEPESVRRRQAAIDELRANIDLREALAVLDEDVRGLDADALRAWAEAPPIFSSRAGQVLGFIVAAGLIASVLACALFDASWWMAVVVLLVGQIVVFIGCRPRLQRIGHLVGPAGEGLAALAQVAKIADRLKVQAPLLVDLRRALTGDRKPPSVGMAKLYGLLLPSPPLLLFAAQLFPPLESWRARLARLVPDWLTAVGELESLLSLSGYAFEHPADPFPEIAETGPLLEGEGLAHPLMPEDVCVRNDVRLSNQLRLVLISGSNMSGKSTLLRTVGTNVALALAGRRSARGGWSCRPCRWPRGCALSIRSMKARRTSWPD